MIKIMANTSKKAVLAVCISALFSATQLASIADAKPSKRGGGGGVTHTNVGGHNKGHNNVNVSGNRGGHNNVNIDVDNNWDRGRWDNDWHPVRTAATVGAVVAVTNAIVGQRYYALPSNTCKAYTYNRVYYYNCNDVWYAPQYVGTQVSYVVVVRPY